MKQKTPGEAIHTSDQGTLGSRYTRWAWVALVCTALTLPLGIFASSWIIDSQGYDPNNLEGLPAGVALLAGSVAVAITLIAPVIGFIFGRKAVQAGDSQGRVPMLLGAVGAAVFVLLNYGPWLLGLLID